MEINKKVNTSISIPVKINKKGIYAVRFRYSNGNGPINTENKCALRSLKLNKKFVGTIVFPQRGKEEWSNWGYSNSVQLSLNKGTSVISLVFEPWNENMNGEINQAFLDNMQLILLE